MTPIIPSLSPLFEYQLPRNISGTDFGTEVRFVVFIPDLIFGEWVKCVARTRTRVRVAR